MVLPAPKFGGIKERYARTHAGQVHRLLDPIRRVYLEFPSRLHYENFLLQFLNPEIKTILLGKAMPRHVQLVIGAPRFAQYYRFADRDSVVHQISTHERALAGERRVTPGIRVVVRTADEIRACPVALDALDAARRLLAMHVDLALDAECTTVYEHMASTPQFVVGEILDRQSPTASVAADKTIVAILRAVAEGACEIDWSQGFVSRTTQVRRIDGVMRNGACMAPGDSPDKRSSHRSFPQAPQASARPHQIRRSHGR